MPKMFVYFFATAALLLMIWLAYGYLNKIEAEVAVGGKASFNIEVVSDLISQAKGLSGRDSLDEDAGMLFVYNNPATRHFWMKGMNFPLDIIWIRDFQIIGVHENVLHPADDEGDLSRMTSPEPADMVLEVNGGLVAKYHIEIEDSIVISKKRLIVHD